MSSKVTMTPYRMGSRVSLTSHTKCKVAKMLAR